MACSGTSSSAWRSRAPSPAARGGRNQLRLLAVRICGRGLSDALPEPHRARHPQPRRRVRRSHRRAAAESPPRARCDPRRRRRVHRACGCGVSDSRRRWRSRRTDRIVVLGDGRLGNLCAQVLAGSSDHVLVVGKHREKLALLEAMGIATAMLRPTLHGPRAPTSSSTARVRSPGCPRR